MPTITTVDVSWETSSTLDAAELRRADSAMFLGDGSNNGVRGGIVRHGDNSLAVSVNGSDQVTVQSGAAVIPAATGLGVYRASLQAATAATAIDSRNATNPRIDLVVFRSTGAVDIITGTPGAFPSAPALPAQSVELARLNVPAIDAGAVTVTTSFRAYATALGGTLAVETAARLPGSGNQKRQRAVALDTGKEYVWSGSEWLDANAGEWVEAYGGPDTYNFAAPTVAEIIAGGGPHNVTVPLGRTLEIEIQLPRLELNGLGGLQVWVTAGAGQVTGGYWENPSGTGMATAGLLRHTMTGTGASVPITVNAIKLGTNGGNIRGIPGQHGPRIKYRIT